MITIRTSKSHMLKLSYLLSDAQVDLQGEITSLREKADRLQKELDQVEDEHALETARMNRIITCLHAATNAAHLAESEATLALSEVGYVTCLEEAQSLVDNLVSMLDGPDAKGSRDKLWLLHLKEAGEAAALLHLLMEHEVQHDVKI